MDKDLDENSLSWFTLDESMQIIPMMKEGVQLELTNNNIVVTKPGSTSHVTQPADVRNIFKSIKSTLRGLRDEDNTNNDLKENILEAIDNHEVNAGKKMNPSYGKKASIGLENLHRAINKVINPDNIRQFFYETGVNNHKTSSYDLSTIEDDKTYSAAQSS